MKILRIRPRGQITLPQSIRKQTGMSEETAVKVSVQAGKVILEPVSIAPFPMRSYTDRQIKEFIKADQSKKIF